MTEEILNLDYNIKLLTLRALNKFPGDRKSAARALGISWRTLQRYKNRFRIRRQERHWGKYYIEEKTINKLKAA